MLSLKKLYKGVKKTVVALMEDDYSRRDFMRQSATTTAGLVAGGYLATSRGYAQNETINIANTVCPYSAVSEQARFEQVLSLYTNDIVDKRLKIRIKEKSLTFPCPAHRRGSPRG